MLRKFLLIAAVASLAAPDAANAQTRDAYPSRPVRMLVAAAPGGNPDVLGRLLAQKLTDSLGKPFIIENAPGAGGVVAAESLLKSPPDGYLLMLGDSGAMAINVVLNSKISYQPLRDFTLVTALAAVPTVIVVHPSTGANTLADFIQLAKSKPGVLNYGSAGNGSIHHLTMAVFLARAGIDLKHIPYRGGTPLITGIMSNEVQAGWSGIPNVQQPIQGGMLKVLAISTAQRSMSLPNVPTVIESGIADFDIATLMGMQGPAGMPRDIVEKLQAAVAKALREPDLAARMDALGMVMRENGTAHYEKFIRDDLERYAAAVKTADIKIE